MNYNAYNNSYGNFAGEYLEECLPNIEGYFSTSQYNNYASVSGAFTIKSNVLGDQGNGNYNRAGYNFDANAGAVIKKMNLHLKKDIYRNSCLSVRPKSYIVYMWQRTS